MNGSPRSMRPVARAEQAERRPRARRSASGGRTAACRSSSSSRTASRSRHPRPQAERARCRTPSEVWQAAYSKAASCSTSLIDAQAVGGVDEQVGRVLDGAARSGQRAAARRRGTRARRSSSRPAYVFQPTTPTRLPGPIPSSARISRQRRATGRAAGSGRLRSWNRLRRIGSGAAPAIPKHSLPTRMAGSPPGPSDEQRLLEARVEAGQVGEVGAVLAVGVDDEPVVAAASARARAGGPLAPGRTAPGSRASPPASRSRAG